MAGSIAVVCLKKIEKKYPNPTTLEQEFKKEDVEPWAKECRPKVY